MDPIADSARAQLRWHAELGANGFDTLDAQAAAENARWRLEAIVRALDELDDTAHLARIFAVVGVEPRIGRKREISHRKPL